MAWSGGVSKRWFRSLVLLPAFMTLAVRVDAAIMPQGDGPEQAISSLPGKIVPSDQQALDELARQVAEAKHVLLELQRFADMTAKVLELGERLKAQRLENDRLRRTMLHARRALAGHLRDVDPMQTEMAALTQVLVANWLESERLEQRAETQHRDLGRAEDQLLDTRQRIVDLKQRYLDRKAELLALKVERIALSIELGQARRQLARKTAGADEVTHQERRLYGEMDDLRQRLTAALRAVLADHTPR